MQHCLVLISVGGVSGATWCLVQCRLEGWLMCLKPWGMQDSHLADMPCMLVAASLEHWQQACWQVNLLLTAAQQCQHRWNVCSCSRCDSRFKVLQLGLAA